MLQQYLPFTVLKRRRCQFEHLLVKFVATAPTVYGIETGMPYHHSYRQIQCCVATAPTVYGIETLDSVYLLS